MFGTILTGHSAHRTLLISNQSHSLMEGTLSGDLAEFEVDPHSFSIPIGSTLHVQLSLKNQQIQTKLRAYGVIQFKSTLAPIPVVLTAKIRKPDIEISVPHIDFKDVLSNPQQSCKLEFSVHNKLSVPLLLKAQIQSIGSSAQIRVRRS